MDLLEIGFINNQDLDNLKVNDKIIIDNKFCEILDINTTSDKIEVIWKVLHKINKNDT